jgi:integrase
MHSLGMSKDWERVSENLVRYVPSGILYLRAKLAGKVIKKSLGIKSVRAGKIKRDVMLADLRAQSGGELFGMATSLETALSLLRSHYEAIPSHEMKDSTKHHKTQILEVLARTLPNKAVGMWSEDDIFEWWNSPGVARYSATRRNAFLDAFRLLCKLLRTAGAHSKPLGLDLKRVPVITKEIIIPSKKQFKRLLEEMKRDGFKSAENAANFVEFMAYSGVRIGDARSVRWEDVGKESIRVKIQKTRALKGEQWRSIPIIPSMKELLKTLDRSSGEFVMKIKCPRMQIKRACGRLGYPNYTPHTFRHLFATAVIEAKVDIPTLSRWLGHSDGGKLAMKTYGHLRDEHSLEQAKKVRF